MPKRNLAWILVVVVIALLLWQLPAVIAERDSVIRHFGVLAEIRSLLLRRYVTPVEDERLVDAAVQAAADAMVDVLHDPHARYLNPDDHRRFSARSEGFYGGVGIEAAAIGSMLIVQNVAPGTPAADVGVLRGDRILAVDTQPVERLGLLEAASLLDGPPDSSVRLMVQTGSAAPRECVLVRQQLRVNPVRGWSRRPDGTWRFVLDPAARIGYVRITSFLPNTVPALDEAVSAMQRDGVRAWILDLRENRGGFLDTAIDVADRFLSAGVIVTTRGRTSDRREWMAQRDDTYPFLPLAALVNGWTASSAEIVAGALRDHRRAILVGERTYGKGSVQELVPLRSGGAVKLTTRYYYLPNGTCIQRAAGATEQDPSWGVQPNVLVALTPRQRERWLPNWLAATWAEGEGSHVTTMSATVTTAAAGNADDDEAGALHALLAYDPQLERAIELLRHELEAADRSARH